ncbi:MAG: TlpA family protein disulfide reductase [Caldilineaceae bacterium]|nr:TlpA family protein disulfide reductase [Caldilineaceae bacterium]
MTMTLRRINYWYGLFWIILLLGSYWVWMNRVTTPVTASGRSPQAALEHPAPDFSLTTLTGETFSLSAVRGTPVVLNFWATWCGPCQRELPALQAAAERYGDRVLIIGVDQGEAPEIVQRYVDQLGLTFPIPLDTEFTVSDQYNVRGLPTTYFIDGEGIIRHLWLGEMNSITLAEGVAQILP